MTLTKVLRDTGLAHATVHGLGSSFRDWCAGIGQPGEIAEAALAHTVGGGEGAHFQSDLFERRRRLIDRLARDSEVLSRNILAGRWPRRLPH